MKKFILFLIVIMVLFYANSLNNNFTLTNYIKGEYISYSSLKENDKALNLGFCCLNKNFKTKSIVGESVKADNLEINSTLKELKARVVKTEYLPNNSTVIYAYTPLIKTNVKLNNKTVNLQIAINNSTCIVGWPLILGSF